MSDRYFLLFKTADAEKRAWRNLAEKRKKAIFPILELTRGRKNRGAGKSKDGKSLPAAELLATKGIYGFESNWQSAVALMEPCAEIFLDLTREPSLSCFEIEELGQSANGYVNWTNFVSEARKTAPNIVPTMLVNPSEDEDEATYKTNLEGQFSKFTEDFTKIAYRVSVLEDADFLYDLNYLRSQIEAYINAGGEFFVILDHEYIRPQNGQVHAKRTSKIITSVKAEVPNAQVICLATSFPKSVTDIGDEEHDVFPVEEMYLFETIKKEHAYLLYGDYGSINPIRNDEIIITQGWRPRIDFVSRREGMKVFYFREKRDVLGKDPNTRKNILAPYSRHYASVARSVISFNPFYENILSSWGAQEIEAAANGVVPSNSPSHWISVRMEIHLVQTLRHLGLDP